VAGVGTAPQSFGQDPVFGKNKVIWKNFDWSYIATKHYDIYFYGNNYKLAKFAAEELENATPQIERELNYKLRSKIPILVYDSHNDFQQTNIGGGLIPEGVGGFTESFKNRVVLPFNGSYEDYRHVLHHELTHAFTFDMLYGGGLGSFISAGALFQLPLWFAEGFAEYSSRHGMDYFGDMVLRDATVNNYWIPLQWAGGFIVYKEGQAAVQYIADHFGEDKISELLSRSRAMLSVEKGMKAALGLSMEDFNRELTRHLKREYWPEIAKRLDSRELGKPLTDHRKQNSIYNEKPAFSPRGDRIAMFSDRGDYTQVYIISAVDGKVLKRLIRGNRGGDFESLHSYVSGLSWSPNGDQIALVGKSKGKDALVIVDSESGRVRRRKFMGVTSLLNPSWGSNNRIAYMGMVDGQSDLYMYDMNTDEVTRLTRDLYDENEPTWSPDGSHLVFASDRPLDGTRNNDVTSFKYGHYNLFKMEIRSGHISPLTAGGGQNREPSYSPDGKRIAYISDRNGIANIYVLNLETGEDVPVTNILTGAASPSWSPDGDKLVFSSFNDGGFDIFLMEEIRPRGKNGELELTPLAKRKLGIPDSDEDEEATGEDGEEDAGPAASLPIVGGSPSSDPAWAADSGDGASAGTNTDDAGGERESITPEGHNDHFGSMKFKTESESDADDSTALAMRKVHLGQDSVIILDPERDSAMIALRVEDAKKEGQEEDGEYAVKKYKARFSPDVVSGAVGYDTFLGLQGQTYFLVSDYMNNHQFYLATDIINTFDDANIILFYNNNAKRMGWGLGVFHTKYFYVDNDLRLVGQSGGNLIVDRGRLFSDRVYGVAGSIRYPLSLFTRLQVNAQHMYIDREYFDRNIDGGFDNNNVQASVLSLSWIRDNTLWGYTGPNNGGRSNVTLEYAADVSDRSQSFWALNADFRRYFKMGRGFTFATRFAGGYSDGSTPKRFYLGGVPNWIGSNLSRPGEIYTIGNLYFSQSSFPLRGYDYYQLAGSRYGLMNFEFRFPLIDYFAMRFPLGLALSQVQGALFLDAGAAWSEADKLELWAQGDQFHLEDLKVGYGFGLRANLGFFVFRWDVGWPSDFNNWKSGAHHYVSMGADF